jgi:hypothetical protein
MSDFDFIFNSIDINSSENVKGRIKTNREQKHEAKMIGRFDELNALFPEQIEPSTTYHLVSSDNFGSIELLRVLSTRIDIKYLGISTWSYNQDFIELIKQQLSNGVEIDFFVDKSMRTRKTALYAQMVNLMDDYKNLKIKVHHMIHSKITIIEAENIHLSIESSANYSNNQRIENFTITENEDVFNFHKNWMNEIIGK